MIFGFNDKMLDVWAEELSTHSLVIAEPLPETLLSSLQARARQIAYKPAQVGRVSRRLAPEVRSDEIAWISDSNAVDAQWLQWLDALQLGLNRRLFLGLTHHESHYALYPPGARYHRHRDAFAEEGFSNRIVSLVLYLNEVWPEAAGGELVLYPAVDTDGLACRQVAPLPGRLVLFLSADLPHEVLPAQQNRYSLAAWFRGSRSN
jgi:SM-20-related protein